MAQDDKWAGTWEMQYKPWPHIPPIIMQLQIGLPEQGVLYPAKINLRYGNFEGIYEVLLARKNDGQLGIGRAKFPLQEKPFKLGIWLWYINGTLDHRGKELAVSRMWEDQFNIWMRGLYAEDEIFVNSKVSLREFLYRADIHLKKINNKPLADSSVQRILHIETRDIYFGIYPSITSRSNTIDMQLEDQDQYDRDTVTLLQNEQALFTREEINDQNRRFPVTLDTGRNLFVFFADNYGTLPPNTGNLVMKIDEKDYSFDFRDRSNVFATFVVADIDHRPEGGTIGKDTLVKIVSDTFSNGRTTVNMASIPVDTAAVVLELWDSQVEDGDSISIRLNDRWVVRGFPVKNKSQRIAVTLQPGENSLLFVADNVGSIPPNTAELRVRFGRKSRSVSLQTDLKKNNAVRLILE